MDLLKQCQQWFEQDEAQKVIDTLEAIPAEERTPELDSELAKAYIAVAHIGEREPFEKALELLGVERYDLVLLDLNLPGKDGMTVLLVEQNANMALKIADLAYVLETGTITMSGTGAELLADSRVKEAYLGKSS